MGVMKTPGVYIVEKSAFPNSVVEVATAVPAFIGYTERADNKGKTLLNTPWRISSLTEFHQYFGMGPTAKFVISERPSLSSAELAQAKAKAKNDAIAAAAKALDVGVATKEQALAAALIAQAGDNLALAQADLALDSAPDDAPTAKAKAAAVTAKTATDKAVTAAQSDLTTAIAEAKAAATKARAAALVAQEKAEASEMKHRAVILAQGEQKIAVAVKAQADAALTLANADAALAQNKSDSSLQEAQQTAAAAKKTTDDAVIAEQGLLAAALQPTRPTDTDAAIVPTGPTAFKLSGKEYLLTQLPGAAGGCFLLYYGMRQFFQNGGGPCYIVSVGSYTDSVEAGKLSTGIDTLVKEQEPTMLVLPDCMLLKVDDCISVQQKALMHCGNVMRNRVAILDIWGGDRAINEGPIADFRGKLGINCLDFAAAYYPWLNTTVVQDSELSYANIDNLELLQSLLKIELKLPTDAASASVSPKERTQLRTVADITNSPADWAAASAAALASVGGAIKPRSEQEQAADVRIQCQLLNKSLLALSAMFNGVLGELKNRLNLLPPSAAMAGIYTMVDNTRGVWKAPANVSLNGVISPAVNLSAEDQEDLNVTAQGKSINAIRSFMGEGVLVWGARTLDGNSLDWRYISVRRTMIMLEESCRLAAKAMVFEPNVANTWVTIKSMIQNFLTGIWKRGGLAGAVPDDAFSVHVGLGETMSAEDILEGILRVTVLVAISRPAEFIEITFQQQMQKS